MEDYSFLLKSLQKQDKILLYGMGENGKNIYQFLQKTGQFHIIGFVDARAKELHHAEVSVYFPEDLQMFPDTAFDKLILTIENQDIGFEVYQQLINMYHVQKSKIIAAFIYTGPFSNVSLEEFARDRSAVESEIDWFIKNNCRYISYFKPIIESLKLPSNVLLSARLKSFVMKLSPKESIVLSYILYCAGRFDAELLENLLQVSLEIEDPALTDLLYGIFIDTAYMPFSHEEYYFPAYYNMRRELLKKICLSYGFKSRTAGGNPIAGKKIKKICIVMKMLPFKKYTGTSLCIQAANILSDCGYDIKIIPLDSDSDLTQMPVLQPAFACNTTSKQSKAYHERMLREEIIVEYPDATCDIRKKLQGQLDKIFEYSPDLILDISDECSVVSYVYAKYFTTLYILMRGYVSCSFFTYLAVRDEKLTTAQNEYYKCPIKTAQYLKMDSELYIKSPKPLKTYSRSDFGCAADDFLFITVGYRLNSELSKEFIDKICWQVLSRPNMKWFVVGERNNYLMEMKERFESKIVYIPYEDDLPALYKICDVYLNPPRMGGGTSISWATHYGLPVVMSSAPNDKSKFALISGLVYSSSEEMVNCLIALQENSKFFAQCKEIAKGRAAAQSSEKQRQLWLKLIFQVEERQQLSTLS